MKRLFLHILYISAILIGQNNQAAAQLVRSFSPRFTTTTRGGITILANSIILSKGSGYDRTALPPGCGAASGGTNCRNDAFTGGNIDIDADLTTFNSSADTLSIAGSCYTIEFAGLYWGAGYQHTTTVAAPASTSWNKVKIKTPGSSVYQTVTASQIDTVSAIFYGYQSFADVTALVRSGGNGEYTIANVSMDTNKANTYGGWTMIIVYRDSTLATKNMTVFDGMAIVGTSGTGGITPVNFGVRGFKCPPSGAVNCRLGVVVYDGDRVQNDGFEVKDTSVNYIEQTNTGESAAALSAAVDAWNSSITVNGVVKPGRRPAYQNTYGYDAHIYSLANTGKKYLRNNDTSLSVRIKTASEGYVLGMLSTEIDTYEPEMLLENSVTDLNGGGLELGDTLLVNATVRNSGTDSANNVRIRSILPAFLKYIPGTITIGGIAKTDAAGDDQAEYSNAGRSITMRLGTGANALSGGKVRNNNADRFSVSYKLSVSTNCVDIGTTPLALQYQTQLLYNGINSGLADSAASRPQTSTACVQPISPSSLYIASGCAISLPLILESFYGNATANCSAIVGWQVAPFDQISHFILQRSTDGTNFSQVAMVNYDGSRNTFMLDMDAPRDYYYRLLTAEKNGVQHYSNTIRIAADCPQATDISLHPNPATNEITFDNISGSYQLLITDMVGQVKINRQQEAGANTISLAGWAPGLYTVRVQTADNKISQLKLIKY